MLPGIYGTKKKYYKEARKKYRLKKRSGQGSAGQVLQGVSRLPHRALPPPDRIYTDILYIKRRGKSVFT